MKTQFFLLIFSINFLSITAQQTIDFSPSLQLNSTYETTMSQSVQMKFDISGEEATIAPLKAQIGDKPILITSDIQFHTDVLSKKNYQYPLHLHILKFDQKHSLMSLPNSNLPHSKLYGKVSYDIQFTVDSFSSNLLGDTMSQKILVSYAEAIRKSFDFPKKTLKINDTFSVKAPVDIPMGEMGNVRAHIRTYYRLVAVRDHIAYFNITTRMQMNMNEETKTSGLEMNAEGEGGGTMEYNIAQKLPTKITIAQQMISNYSTPYYMMKQTLDTKITTVNKKLK